MGASPTRSTRRPMSPYSSPARASSRNLSALDPPLPIRSRRQTRGATVRIFVGVPAHGSAPTSPRRPPRRAHTSQLRTPNPRDDFVVSHHLGRAAQTPTPHLDSVVSHRDAWLRCASRAVAPVDFPCLSASSPVPIPIHHDGARHFIDDLRHALPNLAPHAADVSPASWPAHVPPRIHSRTTPRALQTCRSCRPTDLAGLPQELI